MCIYVAKVIWNVKETDERHYENGAFKSIVGVCLNLSSAKWLK